MRQRIMERDLAKLKIARLGDELVAGSISLPTSKVRQIKDELESWKKRLAKAEREIKALEAKK